MLYEAASHAGGRCRSYFDTILGADIDNGNHLLLSCNTAALAYLRRIDSHAFAGYGPHAIFHFADLQAHTRWALQLNQGRLPLWLLFRQRRVPGTRIGDYLPVLRVL